MFYMYIIPESDSGLNLSNVWLLNKFVYLNEEPEKWFLLNYGSRKSNRKTNVDHKKEIAGRINSVY